MKSKPMKLIKKIGWSLLIILIIAQFFQPEKYEGELSSLDSFINETNPNEEVKIILKESCNDCHSDFTKYPWYSNITPVNYWLKNHIDHGKGHLNFSKWNEYSVGKKAHKFEEVAEMVEAGSMPLNSYTWAHSEARLTDEQRKAIIEWAKGQQTKYEIQEKPQ